MGHVIGWDNADKTVVLQQYTDDANKDDLYHLARKSAELLTSVPHQVHLIIDERNIDMVLTTPDMEYLNKLAPANQGVVVLVVHRLKLNYKRLVQNFGNAIAPKAFDKPYFTTSIEQARAFLQEHFAVRYD